MDLGCDVFDTVTGFVDEHSDWLTTQDHKVAIEASRYGCPWLYKYFIVHWDGGVAPCCMEFSEQDDFFNLRDVPLSEAWNHPTYVRARSLFGRRSLMQDTHVYCENCFLATKSERRPADSAR
jgi:MoaA/NifB/PqqE/SkfB family radical SAM enzyme